MFATKKTGGCCNKDQSVAAKRPVSDLDDDFETDDFDYEDDDGYDFDDEDADGDDFEDEDFDYEEEDDKKFNR